MNESLLDSSDGKVDKGVYGLGTTNELMSHSEAFSKTKKDNSKYEKELLLWAGKLELESLDLKKKSEWKIKTLTDSLKNLHDQLNKLCKSTQQFNVVTNNLESVSAALEKKFQTLKKDLNQKVKIQNVANDNLRKEFESEIAKNRKSQEGYEAKFQERLSSFSQSLKNLENREAKILQRLDLLEYKKSQTIVLPVTNTPISQVLPPDSVLPVTSSKITKKRGRPKKPSIGKENKTLDKRVTAGRETKTLNKASHKPPKKRGRTKKVSSTELIKNQGQDKRMLLSDSEIDLENVII